MGLAARLVSWSYGKTLFLDEAYVASTVVQRDYAGMLHPMDYMQGAPLGFLLSVKTCVYLFGSSEYALRAWSLLAGLASVVLFYMILKKRFSDPFPIAGTAFMATMPFLIFFSNMLKPYMGDGFFALLVVWLYIGTIQGKIRLWVTILTSALLVWFSFPVIFPVTAGSIVWMIILIRRRDYRGIRRAILPFLITGVSFFINLLTYYHNISDIKGHVFWTLMFFPLIPAGPHDIALINTILRHYLEVFGINPSITGFLTCFALVITFFDARTRTYCLFFIIEVFLLLLASYLHFYTMVERLLLFMMPQQLLLITLMPIALRKESRVLAMVTLTFLMLLNTGSWRYLTREKVMVKGQQLNPLIERLGSIGGNPVVYLSVLSIPVYEYKMGYPKPQVRYPKKTVEVNHVIYSAGYYRYNYTKPYSWEGTINRELLINDIHHIIRHPEVYMLFLAVPEVIDTLLAELRPYGKVELVMSAYNTPLYRFSRTISRRVENNEGNRSRRRSTRFIAGYHATGYNRGPLNPPEAICESAAIRFIAITFQSGSETGNSPLMKIL